MHFKSRLDIHPRVATAEILNERKIVSCAPCSVVKRRAH